MKWKNLIILAAVVSFVLLFTLPYILYPFEVPLDTFFKVSNKDLAKPGYVCIILISWYGCPFGAADSWVLYSFLSHYGKIVYNFSYSDPQDVYPNTPAIIFKEFYPNSSVLFRFVYLYNRYLNATACCKVVSNYVSFGLSKISSCFPQYCPLVKEYVVNKWAQGGYFQSAAYMGNPPHIPTTIIISSSKGTYILIGYIYNPSCISGMAPSYILSHLNSLSFIQSGVEKIENLI